jgi:subtilisin family serine protease
VVRCLRFLLLAGTLVVLACPPAPGASRQHAGPHGNAAAEREDGDHDDDGGDAHEREDGEWPRGKIRLRRRPIAGTDARTIRYVPGELLVRFRPGTPRAEMDAAAARAGGTIAAAVADVGMHVVKVSPSRTQRALASLRSEPSVLAVEQDVLISTLDTVPNDALWSTQWGWRLIGAPRAWDATKGVSSVVVAVLDTGVNAGHPDLAGATVPGRDLVNDDADPADDEGHGTAVAGVIAARTNNREGQAGMCWACSVMPVKVLDSSGSGKTSTIAAGIVWATDRGARVINMSLGGAGGSMALQAAVDYAVNKGIVLVAAAGNSGADMPFYPAAYGGVISVGGTTSSDTRYSWSNYGSWVLLTAPGCNTAPDYSGGYIEFCGTSSATPVVAGIAALALSLTAATTTAQVAQALEQTATPLAGVARYGRVNAPTMLTAVAGTGIFAPLPPAAPAPSAPPPPTPATPAPSQPTRVAPVSTERPRLRGRARVGLVLRVIAGSWNPAPTSIGYEWLRCRSDGSRCRGIAGARGTTYRLTRRDRGMRLRAVVIASNDVGATRALTGYSSLVRLQRR